MQSLRQTMQAGGTLVAALLLFTAGTVAQAAPTLTTLYNFTGSPDGASPGAGVVIGNGLLYGTTRQGGTGGLCIAGGCGTVFSLTPPASAGGVWTEAVIEDFNGGNGVMPTAGLVVGEGGVLYGVTLGETSRACGGAECGIVFSLTPPASPGGAWTETVLHEFAGAPDGAYPYGSLAIGPGGVLYGTTSAGGTANAGAVFSLTPPASPGGAWTEAVIYSFFTFEGDGAIPYSGVVIGKGAGGRPVLYGTTYAGGAFFDGTVYALRPPTSAGGAWTETILHSFAGGNDGALLRGGLTIGSGGVLYGTTEGGGPSLGGTVFSLTPPASPGGAWTENVLYSFAGGSDGVQPEAGVTIAGGKLVGTTTFGGTHTCTQAFPGCGTVFSLTPPASPGGAWSEVVLHNFQGSDGAFPKAGLTVGSGPQGQLVFYGTTSSGGGAAGGTVFSLMP